MVIPSLAFSILLPLPCNVLSSVERKSSHRANLVVKYFSMLVSLKFKSFATLSVSLSLFDVSAKYLLI